MPSEAKTLTKFCDHCGAGPLHGVIPNEADLPDRELASKLGGFFLLAVVCNDCGDTHAKIIAAQEAYKAACGIKDDKVKKMALDRHGLNIARWKTALEERKRK